jgi:hypothetical protein
MHLWPLLALVGAGAKKGESVNFTEAKDVEFWDKYARYPGEAREKSIQSEFTPHYYIEPLVQADKASDYPHRSPSTIRKRTFANSWHAAAFDDSTSMWQLGNDYADIFVREVLRRGTSVHRVPVVDLAIWLFREQEFPDGSTSETSPSAKRNTKNCLHSSQKTLLLSTRTNHRRLTFSKILSQALYCLRSRRYVNRLTRRF